MTRIASSRWLPRRIVAALGGVVFLSLCAGCVITKTVTDVNHLYQAQAAFNEAATLENQMRLEAIDPSRATDTKPLEETVVSTVSVQSGYASALLSINKIYPAEKELLKANKLLGATLTLKALVLWRTGAFEDALATAELAKREAGEQLYPRDAALIEAIPGLIKNSLAFKRIAAMRAGDAATNRTILDEEIRRRLVGSDGAVADIQRARAKVDRKHEVNVYLISAQLAAYRNYQRAYQEGHDGNNPPDSDEAKQAAQYDLGDLKTLVDDIRLGPAGKTLVEYWETLCLIKPKRR